ncbi:MAG TPA: dienelactone hydrolase family protein [Acidisarcina sp.]
MSESVKLTAQDGHELDAYVVRPIGKPVAGLVLVQEIYGVNAHIRSVADGYAADGFVVIAPAIFDRIERGVQLNYSAEGSKTAYELMNKLDPKTALFDIEAALGWVREATGGLTAGVVGFCYGGLLAWLSATRLDPAAAVGYYPGGIGRVAEETPKAPVMLHIGTEDSHIPRSDVEKVRAAHPEVQVFDYAGAEHAFNRDVGQTYDTVAAKLARERTVAFLRQYLT